jgi:hypothetical protein
MNPRRLHSDTIFSMSGISLGSAIARQFLISRPNYQVQSEAARHLPTIILNDALLVPLCVNFTPNA